MSETAAPIVKDVNADDTAKLNKQGKVDYTELLTEDQLSDPNVYPFQAVPEDYDPEEHKPLKKKDFAQEFTYHYYRADLTQAKADELRRLGDEVKANGGKTKQQSADRLKKMAAKVQELKAKLLAQGFTQEQIAELTG